MHGVGADSTRRAFRAFNLPDYIPVPEQVWCVLQCVCTVPLLYCTVCTVVYCTVLYCAFRSVCCIFVNFKVFCGLLGYLM